MKSGGGCVKPARGCENPSRGVIEVRAARRDPPGRLSRSIAEMPDSKTHTGFGHARWTCSEPVKRRGGSVNHQAVSHASSLQWGFEIPPSTDCLLRVLLCRWKQAEAVTSQGGSVNAIRRSAAAVGRQEAVGGCAQLRRRSTFCTGLGATRLSCANDFVLFRA